MIEGNDINIRIVGNGEPAIVFVHGFGCEHEDWAMQIDALSADFRCVALDLPGHGASAMPREPTIEAMAAAVNAAKERSGAQKVILVGHSLAARVIREAYCQSTKNVAALMMIDTRHDSDASRQRVEDALNAEGYDRYIRSRFGPMILDRNAHLYRERFIERAVKLGPRIRQGPVSGNDQVGYPAGRGDASGHLGAGCRSSVDLYRFERRASLYGAWDHDAVHGSCGEAVPAG